MAVDYDNRTGNASLSRGTEKTQRKLMQGLPDQPHKRERECREVENYENKEVRSGQPGRTF